jgi:hypothetical protein
VEYDSESGARSGTEAGRAIVDVILTGKVNTFLFRFFSGTMCPIQPFPD